MHFKQNTENWHCLEFFWPNVFYGQISWSKPMERVQGALNDHLWHDSRTSTVSGI